jgi:hypothetical protein
MIFSKAHWAISVIWDKSCYNKTTKHTIKKTWSTTCKSLGHSLHKLLLVPLFCIKLFLFSNTIQTFYNQLFWWKPTWTRGQNTPWCKDITRSEHKSRRKSKAKRSSRKREHPLKSVFHSYRSTSVLGKWKTRELLKKEFVGVQHLLQQTKLKTKNN